MFQFVSKRFETTESVDLEIFSPFQFVSVVLLYNLYVSMFRNTRYGAGIFTFLCFSLFRNVWKRFETIESVDLDIFSPFQFVSVVLLYIKSICFNVSKHQIWGLEFSPFFVSVCFETFQNN